MSVFISHISEEAPLALCLKEWIEPAFNGTHPVFVSSDENDIPVGRKWLERIGKALDDAKVLIVLCSPQSIKRPWINFEAGCGWIKDVPIIPVCHAGMTKSTLPRPLSDFQAADIDEKGFPSKFFKGMAKHLGVKRVPRLALDEFLKEVRAASGECAYTEENMGPTAARKKIENKAKQSDDLSAQQLAVLMYVAETPEESLERDEVIKEMAQRMRTVEMRAKVLIDRLIGKGYLLEEEGEWWSEDVLLKLTGKAESYLVDNGHV